MPRVSASSPRVQPVSASAPRVHSSDHSGSSISWNIGEEGINFEAFKQIMSEAKAASKIQMSFKKLYDKHKAKTSRRKPTAATHGVLAASGVLSAAKSAPAGAGSSSAAASAAGKEEQAARRGPGGAKRVPESAGKPPQAAAGGGKKKKLFMSNEEIEAKEAALAASERLGFAEWTKWIGKIGVAQAVMAALKVSFRDGELARASDSLNPLGACLRSHAAPE
jgi:hypothetical protein